MMTLRWIGRSTFLWLFAGSAIAYAPPVFADPDQDRQKCQTLARQMTLPPDAAILMVFGAQPDIRSVLNAAWEIPIAIKPCGKASKKLNLVAVHASITEYAKNSLWREKKLLSTCVRRCKGEQW